MLIRSLQFIFRFISPEKHFFLLILRTSLDAPVEQKTKPETCIWSGEDELVESGTDIYPLPY